MRSAEVADGGYLGSMASDSTIGLRLGLQQVGRNATDDANLSRVYGGKMTNHCLINGTNQLNAVNGILDGPLVLKKIADATW